MSRDEVYLLDMLNAARDGLLAVEGISREEFMQDRFRRSHARVAVETIGEAARQVSAGTQAAHPEIPWPEMIGMRHRLIHGYRRIDWQIVWDTVTGDFPALIAALEPLVPREEP